MGPVMATTRISEVDGDRAEWSLIDRVVYVRAVQLADGTRTAFDPAIALGEAFSLMPRRLWDEIRVRAERVRDRAPNGGRS